MVAGADGSNAEAQGWRPVFIGMLSTEDVDGMVADIIETVQARLAVLEFGDDTPTLH